MPAVLTRTARRQTPNGNAEGFALADSRLSTRWGDGRASWWDRRSLEMVEGNKVAANEVEGNEEKETTEETHEVGFE